MKDIREIRDVESEAGIIATILHHPEFTLHSDDLTPHHFTEPENGYIYYAISELAKRNVDNVDAYNIFNILNAKESTRKVTQQITIESLNDLIAVSGYIARHTIEEYQILVENVLDKAFRRDMVKTLTQCKGLCCNYDIEDIKTIVYEKLDKIMSEYTVGEEITVIGNKVDELWNQINERRLGDGVCGLASKFPIVKSYFTYEKQELIVVAAARKEGKSIFCLNELVHQLKQGKKCLYIDTELSDRQHMERLLSHLTGIPCQKIKNGEYNEEGEKKLKEAIKWIKAQPYVHVYLTNPTKDKILTIVKKLQNTMGLDFVVYDYIKSQDSTSSSELYNIMGDLTNFLKNTIAGACNLSVLAAAQLNRGGEIADSYKIEQFASVISILKAKSREEKAKDGAECGNYKLFIKLNRLGEQMSDIETDYIDLQFWGNIVTFEQATKQHEIQNPY
jgi:replicative DNA helicase